MTTPCTASDADDALLSEQSDMFQATASPWRRGVGFSAVVLALVAAAACSFSRQVGPSGPSGQGRMGAVTMLEEEEGDSGEVACVAPGTNCLDAGCCISGGAKGYQCYEKTKDWGECFDAGNCTPGVHEPEKEGTWDANGVFQKLKWSCKEVGKVSKPACWSYHDDKCPKDRCDVIKKKGCVPKCSTFGDGDGCWQSGACMWTGSACENGCWLVEKEDDCAALERCQWRLGENKSSCGLACKIHSGADDCKAASADKCMWDNGKCVDDPCSAKYSEDCRSTKCCSAARGAAGSTCFAKNKNWASCQDSCDSSANKGWSCEKIGERSKIPAPCSWAGKECSQTQCCGNQGFSCIRKDDTYAECVLSNKHTTWTDDFVPPPEGWDGTVLGKWNENYGVDPAGPDEAVAGTSLFCFMAVLPDSPEVALMEVAKKKKMGVFACNASKIFDSWVSSSEGWDTGESTLVNTAVFFKVWDQVREDGRYREHDWTCKVDADAAFVPERLRSHLWQMRPPAGQAIYLHNTNQDAGLSNGQFLGAVEIISTAAVQLYFDNAEDCQKSMGDNSGEDGFIKGCLDGLGVGFMLDGHILKPDFAAIYCQTESQVSFHPLKDPAVLENCYNIIQGKPPDFAHNIAPGSGY